MHYDALMCLQALQCTIRHVKFEDQKWYQIWVSDTWIRDLIMFCNMIRISYVVSYQRYNTMYYLWTFQPLQLFSFVLTSCSSLVHDCQVQYASMPSGLLARIGCYREDSRSMKRFSTLQVGNFDFLFENGVTSCSLWTNDCILIFLTWALQSICITSSCHSWIKVKLWIAVGCKCFDHLPRFQKSPHWLVVGLEHDFYFSIQLGISPSQLTNSYFSEE